MFSEVAAEFGSWTGGKSDFEAGASSGTKGESDLEVGSGSGTKGEFDSEAGAGSGTGVWALFSWWTMLASLNENPNRPKRAIA